MTNVHTDSSDQGFVLGNKVLVAEVFAKNGFLVLSSVTGEEQTSEVNVDQIDQGKGGEDTPSGCPAFQSVKAAIRITRDATLHGGEEVIRSPAEDVSTEGVYYGK
jgi:hypothetical protein